MKKRHVAGQWGQTPLKLIESASGSGDAGHHQNLRPGSGDGAGYGGPAVAEGREP